MQLIPLTKGYKAMIDDEDFEMVMKYSWHIHKSGKVNYARNGAKVYLHRYITNEFVDHIDRDGLNCQRHNLRLATRSQNQMNRKIINSTGYRGVTKSEPNGWKAIIYVNRQPIYLGSFATTIDAAYAYDDAARQYHGEFAVLNFPNGE